MDGMATYILMLLASLVAGLAAGLLAGDRIPGTTIPGTRRYVSAAMTCLVFALILLMGLKAGSNRDVVANLGAYGLQSFLITALAVAGSIAAAMLFERLLLSGGAR